MPKITKILAPAGCGKTTILNNMITNLLNEKGIDQSKIAFSSFANSTIKAFENKVVETLYNSIHKFENFSTLHSIGNSLLEDQKAIMSTSDYKKVAKECGLMFYDTKYTCSRDLFEADTVQAVESISRLRGISLREAIVFNNIEISIDKVKLWKKTLEKYKGESKIDFTDMILKNPEPLKGVEYMFIDEAQDLTPLQWAFVFALSKNCKELIVAGDGNQAIYEFAGATPKIFLELKADKNIYLNKSYRVSKQVYNLSERILSRIKNKVDKSYQPTNKDGNIKTTAGIPELKIEKDKTYLFLARSEYSLKTAKEFLTKQNILLDYSLKEVKIIKQFLNPKISIDSREKLIKKYGSISVEEAVGKPWYKVFTFHNQYQLLKINQNNPNFIKNKFIKVSTIHKAKGLEADIVVLNLDINLKTRKLLNTDAELRVWYVAITRAKENLFMYYTHLNYFCF